MKAAIYIQIGTDTGYIYEKVLLTKLKQNLPELVIFDFDTQSDRVIIGYAMDLLDKADKIVVIIEADDSPASNLITFLEKVITYKSKCLVLLNGNNALVARMMKLLETNKFRQGSPDYLTQSAMDFLMA